MAIEICDCGKFIDLDNDCGAYSIEDQDSNEIKLKAAMCPTCREELQSMIEFKAKAKDFGSEAFDWVTTVDHTVFIDHISAFVEKIDAYIDQRCERPKALYSICEMGSFMESAIGACIDEGYDLAKLLDSVTKHFENRAIEDGEYGEGSVDVHLITVDLETDDQVVSTITIEWDAERDTYDGGRADYLKGIGAA